METEYEKMIQIEKNIEAEEIEKKRRFKLEVDSIEPVIAKKKRFNFLPVITSSPDYTVSDKIAGYFRRVYPKETSELINEYEEIRSRGDDGNPEELDEYIMYMINFLYVKQFPKERNTCAFPHEINFSFANFKLRNKTNQTSKDKYGASITSTIITEDKNHKPACCILRGSVNTVIRSSYKYRSITLDMPLAYLSPLDNLRITGSRAFAIQYDQNHAVRNMEDIQLAMNKQENPIIVFDGYNIINNGQINDESNYYFVTKLYEINCNPSDEHNKNFVSLKGIINFAILIE